MKRNTLPSQEEIQLALDYNPETGSMKWKVRDLSSFSSESAGRRWNFRYAGKEAGYNFKGYKVISINKKKYLSHRLAWMHFYGEQPDDIDHINHNPSDNRIANLRSVSHRENLMNTKKKKSNKSGVTGVYFEKQTGRWRAYINVLGKSIKLGRFDDFTAAAKARSKAEVRYGFHKNHGVNV